MSEALSIVISTAVAALIGGLAGWVAFRGSPARTDWRGRRRPTIPELH